MSEPIFGGERGSGDELERRVTALEQWAEHRIGDFSAPIHAHIARCIDCGCASGENCEKPCGNEFHSGTVHPATPPAPPKAAPQRGVREIHVTEAELNAEVKAVEAECQPSASAREVAGGGDFDPNDIRERWAQLYNHTAFRSRPPKMIAEVETEIFDKFNDDLPRLLESFSVAARSQWDSELAAAYQMHDEMAVRAEALEQAAQFVKANTPYLQGVGSVGVTMAEHILRMQPDPNFMARERLKARIGEHEVSEEMAGHNLSNAPHDGCWLCERKAELMAEQAKLAAEEPK